MSEAVEVPLEDLEGWMKRETAQIVEPLRIEGNRLLDDVRGRLDDFRGFCERLLDESEKEMEKENPKTHRPAKAANRLARSVLEALDKVTVPNQVSHEGLQMVNENFERVLVAVGEERGRWFPSMEPYFILDRRRFDAGLKRVAEAFGELRTFSSQKYGRAEAVEMQRSAIGRLSRLLEGLDGVERRRRREESRMDALEGRIREEEGRIAAIQGGGEMRELLRVEEKIEELEGRVKLCLRHLQKPLLKLQNLVRDGGYRLPLDEARKLSEYLRDPLEALAIEEAGYRLLRGILQAVSDALDQKKLKLKSSRLRKAQEQIKDILQRDAFVSLHRECKEVFAERRRLSASTAALQSELTRHETELEGLLRQRRFVDSKRSVLDDEYQKLLGEVQSQRKMLEKTVSELTGKSVNIPLRIEKPQQLGEEGRIGTTLNRS